MSEKKTKFKVGDKVKIIADMLNHELGEIHTIKKIVKHSYEKSYSYYIQDGKSDGWNESRFELVEESPMPVTKKEEDNGWGF
jgi:hypothetical protein